jgi:hypothetical protein
VKTFYVELLDWVASEDLGHALEFSLKKRAVFVNCNWGASSRQPGGKGQYDAREGELGKRIEKLMKQLESALVRGLRS